MLGFLISLYTHVVMCSCTYDEHKQHKARRVKLRQVCRCAAYPARRGCFIPSVSARCGTISRPARGGSGVPSAACTWGGSRSSIPVGSRGCPRGGFPAVGGWGSLDCVPICYLGLLAAAAEGFVSKGFGVKPGSICDVWCHIRAMMYQTCLLLTMCIFSCFNMVN